MAPQHLEVLLQAVVGRSFLAVFRKQVGDVEIAVVLVALGIGAARAESPRAFGVYFARKGKVYIVADGEIVAAVAQIKAAVVVVAESGHYHARRIFFAEREVAERHRERERKPGEHHIGRTGDYVLARTHLGLGELHVKMRVVVVVAGGVASVLYVVAVVHVFFSESARQIAFALLRHHIGDYAFRGLEVVAHRLGLVVGTPFVEHRRTLDFADAVGSPYGIHRVVAEIHLYLLRIELYVAIGH